jgi:hypothetical protein
MTRVDKYDLCMKTPEDGIFIVACRHVVEDDFDEDEEGERVPRIRVIAPTASKPGPTYHLCDQAACTSAYALCAPCATNL